MSMHSSSAKHAMSRGARRLRRSKHKAHAAAIAPARRPRDWAALALLMAAAAFVFFWNLTASGYANEFYSAAAQAGAKSWEAYLWGGLDAGGAITVDKPPASIWLMALSVRLLGLSSFAILLPQALMGVACTYLVYAIVRRGWGNAAGIVAGTVFITTPVAALMFRFNNPDALLILLMLGAAACVLRALELPASAAGNRRRTAWYAAAGALIGLGFLTKQFQVLLVLPGFAVAMLALSPARWPRRFLDAAVALGTMCLAAGWWIALTVIVPGGSRPYFGGSQTDSFIELTFGYNGLGRLTGNETGSVIPGVESALVSSSQGGMWGETGLLRLWTNDFGDQITWLAPLAFAGIVLGLVAARRLSKRRMGTVGSSDTALGIDATRTRIQKAQIAVFGSWLLVTWLVFSLMAGIFHAYYTVALAPAVAVLAAICLSSLRALWNRPWAQGVAGLLLAGTAAWEMALILRSGSYPGLAICVGAVGVGAGLAICALGHLGSNASSSAGKSISRPSLAVRTAIVLGAVALMAGPVTWTACTIATGHTGSIVTAGPNGGRGGADGQSGPGGSVSLPSSGESDSSSGDGSVSADSDPALGNSPQPSTGGGLLGGTSANEELTALLTSTASSYRWAAATTGSQNAASLQLASDLSVMAIGGFNGSDPAPTLEQFKTYVAEGLIKYYVASGDGQSGMGGTQMGGSSAASEIAQWVAENFTAQSIGNSTVYDLQAS